MVGTKAVFNTFLGRHRGIYILPEHVHVQKTLHGGNLC